MTFKGHENVVYSLEFFENDDLLVSGSSDGFIRVWSVSRGECIKSVRVSYSGLKMIAISERKKLMASASYDNRVGLWKYSY